ncbi:MAG: hypothetical protein JRH20_04785 [Deltaproteobacteria bacterium]|nr:hypothetical protein [Deltaproteobacteria bacterium]
MTSRFPGAGRDQFAGLVIGAAIVLSGCARIGFEAGEGHPTRDGSVASSLLMLDEARIVNGLDNATFQGDCFESLSISIVGDMTSTVACEGGRFLFAPTASTDAQRQFDLSQEIDGLTHKITARWIRDTLAPEFVADRFMINGGSTTTRSPFVALSFAVTDALTPIVDVCVNRSPSPPPDEEDLCWIALDHPTVGLVPGTEIATDAFPFNLGFLGGSKTVFGWARDEVGNISLLSNQGQGTDGLDRASTTYVLPHPPVVTDILATTTNTPHTPPSTSELTVAAGDDVYIKWNAQDDEALAAKPITLFFTVDDKTFVPITTDLPNAANGACTLSPGATGCYHWVKGAPTAGYFKVRVVAKDVGELIGGATSVPLNAGSTRFLAGNTDPGTDLSGTAAMFFNNLGASNDTTDPHSFVVTSKGIVYFRDIERGILEVRLPAGIQRVLIPLTSSSTGDGGPISAATVSKPIHIELDSQERLLIFDGDRIRRVDTLSDPMTIDTIIGGGTNTGDEVAAHDLLITGSEILFTPLPNGDLVFQSDLPYGSDGQHRIRIYRALTKRVESLTISGTFDGITPAQDISLCPLTKLGVEYNPSTSEVTHIQGLVIASKYSPDCLPKVPGATEMTYVSIDPQTGRITKSGVPGERRYSLITPITGKTGQLFFVSRSYGDLSVYDPETETQVVIAGSALAKTPCLDGTPKNECRMSPSDIFVARDGQVYFSDTGRIRIVAEDDSIWTLLGHGFFFGDLQSPSSARFGEILNVALWNDGVADHFVLLDGVELRLREVTEGGVVKTLAGTGINGIPETAKPADQEPIYLDKGGRLWPSFDVDPISGDIFFNRGTELVAKLDRMQNRWTDLVGGGVVPFYSAAVEGLPGGQVFMPDIPKVLAYTSRGILVVHYWYDGDLLSARDTALNLYEPTTGTATRVAHAPGLTGNAFCADSTPLLNCALPNAPYFMAAAQDDAGQFILGTTRGTDLHIEKTNGTLGLLINIPRTFVSFTYRKVSASVEVIYYCSHDEGRLYRVDLASGVEEELPHPSASMRCTGERLIYSSDRNSLIFPYLQNGLGGLAEIVNPP